MSSSPSSFRLTAADVAALNGVLTEVQRANPDATLIGVLEAEVEDFGSRMLGAPRIQPRTADLASLRDAEKVVGSVASLLEAAVRNRWPLHALARSPEADVPKLKSMNAVISDLEPNWRKCHAVIYATGCALGWMAKGNVAALAAAADALGKGTGMTEEQVNLVEHFARSLGLRVPSPRARTYTKPAIRDEHLSCRFSLEARAWLKEIAETYTLEGRSAALRLVAQSIGKPVPTIIAPTFAVAPGGGEEPQAEVPGDQDTEGAQPLSPLQKHLGDLTAWRANASIALKNGRTPAVPTEVDLTGIFDQTFQGAMRMRASHKVVSSLCTAVTMNHLNGLTEWCRGRRDEGTRRPVISLFHELGILQRGN